MPVKDRPALIIFTYKRYEHLKHFLESLALCHGLPRYKCYFFCDGPKNPQEYEENRRVHSLVESFKLSHKEVVKRKNNLGLAQSIILGVSEVINQHGSAIVLEDDLNLNSHILEFFNQALITYKDDQTVFSIGGFNYRIKKPFFYTKEVYRSLRFCSWGWATWADRWNKVVWEKSFYEQLYRDSLFLNHFSDGGQDLPGTLFASLKGQVDSWAIRFDAHHALNKVHCIRPLYSLVKNNGLDGSGTNCGHSDVYDDNFYWKLKRAPFTSLKVPLNWRYIKRFRKACRG